MAGGAGGRGVEERNGKGDRGSWRRDGAGDGVVGAVRVAAGWGVSVEAMLATARGDTRLGRIPAARSFQRDWRGLEIAIGEVRGE